MIGQYKYVCSAQSGSYRLESIDISKLPLLIAELRDYIIC